MVNACLLPSPWFSLQFRQWGADSHLSESEHKERYVVVVIIHEPALESDGPLRPVPFFLWAKSNKGAVACTAVCLNGEPIAILEFYLGGVF